MKTLIITSLLFSAAIISCSNESTQQEEITVETSVNPVIETEEQIETQTCKRVTKEEFNDYIANNTDFQIIDVRTPGEFQQGNIDGSINVDFRDVDFDKNIQDFDKTKPTLIYCQAGGRSSKALKKMKNFGFDFVLELAGGFGAY